MHILTSSQTDVQTIKFAPRSIGALQYLLHLQEEESGTTFQMIGYGIQDDSYVSITRTFPLYENLYYYLRVFRLPSGALSSTMSALDEPTIYRKRVTDDLEAAEGWEESVFQCVSNLVDPYTSKTRRQANELVTSYMSSGEILNEIYRGKVFCTNSTDLQDFSIYDKTPMTQQPLDNTAKWVTI